MVVFTALTLVTGYVSLVGAERENLTSISDIAAASGKNPQEIAQLLNEKTDSDIRVTFFSSDGKATFDSEQISESEYDKQPQYQIDETVIFSVSGKEMLFYAVEFDGGILRFGRVYEGFMSVFVWTLPVMLALYTAMVFAAYMTSKLLTKQLISPLNSLVKKLDIITATASENTPITVEYKELEPLAETIGSLRIRLGAYIRKLLETEQIRRDFSANVSHELKTPLTTIKGFAEMMENGLLKNENEIKKYGGTINRESARLLSLIDDVIRLSEIEEKKDGNIETVSLSSTANDVADMLSDIADKSKVRLSVVGDDVLIKGNQIYIYELFLNLMENAVKYNKSGGNVWVRVFKEGANAVICVADTGIGIPDDSLDRIFERFYRVDKSRSKQTSGTGLGLSIVKHVVDYHHGEIAIKSTLGKGTEITVKLPRNI